MTESNKTKRIENVLAATLAVLLGAVLLTSHAVSGVMARYTAAGTSSDEARVALFGHDESIVFDDNWAASLKPGDHKTLTLKVSNAKEGKVSEVAQAYDIELETAGNLPLSFTLADATNVDSTFDSPTVGTSGSFKTYTWKIDGKEFKPGVERTDTYTLSVDWPKDKDDPALANIPDFLQVNINVTQID